MSNADLAKNLAEKSIFTACLGAAEHLATQYPKIAPNQHLASQVQSYVLKAVNEFMSMTTPEALAFRDSLQDFARSELTPESSGKMAREFVDTFKRIGREACESFMNPPASA